MGALARVVIASLAVSAAVAVVACEQRFSASPPVLPPADPQAASAGLEALLRPADAGARASAVDDSHAMVITLCASSPAACPGVGSAAGADGGAPADGESGAGYHVVFGSGRGVMRTRGQALADLYKELRDRTASGERLAARTHVPAGTGGSTKAATKDSDALAASASRLLDVVDGVGEVTLDLVHATSGCILSLAREGGDAGAPQCLIKEPERAKRRGGGGIPF
jgi:hypothetical protein